MRHCYRIRQLKHKSKEHTLLKATLMLFCFLTLTSSVFAAEVFTDRADYPPGDSVVIIGVEFQAYETVTIQVTHFNGVTPDLPVYDPWDLAADDFGDFEAFWIVPDTALGETLLITATGQSSGYVATATFTDASTILALTSNIPDLVCPGETYNICATLYQKCQGGTLGELPGRQLDFYLNNGDCGVDVGQTPVASGFTDSNGEACVNITIPTTPGDYSITVFFTGEDKPGPAEPANGVCNPDERVQLSNSKDCDDFTATTTACNTPPTCNVPADQTISQCTPTQVSLPVSCSDPDGNLSAGYPMIVSGPGSLVGGNWVYTPAGDETAVVTIRCQDDFGAYCEATFTIIFDINSAPVITCPADITVECDESTDPSNTGTATATDDYGTPTITYSDTEVAGSCPQEKVITRTWTATDVCSATDQCVQTITVVDNTAPIITCPADVTIECDESTDPSNTGSATATDNCDASVTISYTDATVGNILTRTWTATDDCGNSANCDQTITIVDTTDPVITCPADITVECDESTDPLNTGTATATDNCDASPTITYTDTETSGACPQEKVITRTWTATDDDSNSASCVQTITVVDTTDPIITCPADITIECDESTDPSNTGTATATDNCDATVTITYSDATVGNVITRTWTATDDCGNSATCDQIITIVDTTDPVITCPADITVQCDESTDPSNTGSATATDNCDTSPTITYSDSEAAGACPQEKVITRTWTATDNASNSASCVQTITVIDDTDPVITCPTDVTVECDGSIDPSATGSATATDNCDASLTITYSDVTTGNVITRTWTATDDCGNSASCDQLLTIDDTTDPVITCPTDITVQCDESTDPSNTGSATATDNCDTSPTITYSDSEAVGSCPQEKVITRTWTATDNVNNSASCVQTITVIDDTDPVITCPADITIECDESTDPSNTGSATATDNCDATVTITYSDVTVGNVITRTWTAADDCGNSATCDQVITVVDTTDPVITCPTDITVQCDESTDPSNTGSATATDNCDTSPTIAYSDSEVAGSCPQEKVITRTWTATDNVSNSASCIQTITVIDDTDPIIVCPVDITIECDESSDPSNTGSATATDNCDASVTISYTDATVGNVITRTWTATDDCGNSASCDQLITINDTTDPIITCPTDITVQCDESTDPSNTGSATATDNCASPTITYTDTETAGTCPQEKVITRTWTATDDASNSSSCIQTITVIDDTDPVITCPADITIECDESSDPSNTGSATATDNCDGIVTIGFTDVTAGNVITRTWTATDDCGNSVSCDQIITIVDTTDPIITCPTDITVQCDESTDPSNTGSATAIDNCDASPTITYSDSEAAGACPQEKVITRTWTATDNASNSASCVQIITVVDDTDPIITCPSDISIECDESSDPSNTGSATATDNCDASVTINYNDVTVGNVITRTWTATDDCGNSASCDQIIFLAENNPPTASCPGNSDMLVCDLSPITISGFSCDDIDGNLISCEVDNGTLSGGDVTFTPVEGINTITLTATDACGLTASCQTTITITLNSPPEVTFPIFVVAPEFTVCNLEPMTILGEISCGDPDGNLATCELNSGTVNGDGSVTFTPVEGINDLIITATDECGETAIGEIQVLVYLRPAPEPTCPGDQELTVCDLSPITIAGFDCGYLGDGGTCEVDNGTLADGSVTFTPVVGVNTITLTATDECGQVGTCQTNITVNMNAAPSATCPGDMELFVCDLSPITIGGFDCNDPDGNIATCEVDNGTLNDGSVTFTPVEGVNTITLTATDDCGETASCLVNIDVSINQSPDPKCPADMEMFVCDLQQICIPGFSASDPDNNLESFVPSVGTLNGGTLCFTPVEGENIIVMTATDECGLSEQCTFTIDITVNTPPEAHCPGSMTLYLFELEEVCIPGFYCTDIDDNIVSCEVNVGTLIGDELCFTPVEGNNELIITATDECGAGSRASCGCIMNINVVIISNCPKVTISTELGVIQGQYRDVLVTLENATYEIGGFDFLIAYDASALSFMHAEPRGFINDCKWEYFTYRTGAEGNCGDACPSGLVRVFALAETNNGPGINPDCLIPPDAGPYELFNMRFFVTNDRTFECQFVPINFFWGDCGDNSFSSGSGDTLFVDKLIYDYKGNLIWDEEDDGLYPEELRPQFWGTPDYCLVNPMPDKPTAIRCIDFQHGGINIICADDIDDRGDLNLNGVSNEIADAVVFTNYFTHGMDAFVINPDGQTAASDANADGIPLSVADLVYIIRIINGDVLPIDKIVPYKSTVGIGSRGQTIVADGELGAAAFVFAGDAEVVLTDNASHMQMKSNFDGINTRVVVYSFNQGDKFSGEILRTDGRMLSVEASDYYGNLYKVGQLPNSFSLSSYPNPFNPTTTIEMMLPTASDWSVDIFNVSGQKVGAYSGRSESGLITISWDATGQSSGIYFIKAKAGNYTATRKAILLK